jgi:hypothetical protein
MHSVMCLFDGSLTFQVPLSHVISNETNCDTNGLDKPLVRRVVAKTVSLTHLEAQLPPFRPLASSRHLR